jgi:hypothetical protein
MMDGMMGSLLIVNGGDMFTDLPVGVECPPIPGVKPGDDTPTDATLVVKNFAFQAGVTVKSMGSLTLKNDEAAGGGNHSIAWDSSAPPGTPLPLGSAVVAPGGVSPKVTMPMVSAPVTLSFHCGIHPGMMGSIVVQP